MNWKFWKKATPLSNPKVTLELLPSHYVAAFVSLPPPQNEEEAEITAKRTAALLFLLNKGDLVATMVQAVQGMKDQKLAQSVLFHWRQAEAEAEQVDAKAAGPVVHPTQVFSRGQND